MTVDTVVCDLICHDTPSSIVDQDINSVSAASDHVCRLFRLLPVREITLQPCDFLSSFRSHLFFNSLQRVVDYLLGHRQNEKLLKAMREKGVSAAIADAFRSTRDDCNLSLQVGSLVKVELLVLRNQGMGSPNTHILSDGLLDGFHGFWELFIDF